MGVLVEVNSETDFVANTDEFKPLVKDIALHIASPASPSWVTREDVPGRPARLGATHLRGAGQGVRQARRRDREDRDGKLESFYKDNVLLDQPFVKDDSKTIQQLLDETSAQVGEKVAVRRFVRYKLGEGAEWHEGSGRA